MSNRFTFIAATYLIFKEDNKILLSRRFNTGYEDGKYSLPAGHLEGNETVREGAVREAKEEIGIDIELKDIEVAHVMHRKTEDGERFDFFVSPKTCKGDVKNCEPHKCDDLSWFPLDDLPDNTIPYVRQAIECTEKKMYYSEHGWGM